VRQASRRNDARDASAERPARRLRRLRIARGLRAHRGSTTIQRSERPALRAAKYQQISLFCYRQLQPRRNRHDSLNRASAPVDTDHLTPQRT
jgi:hypothetical protein